MPPTKPRTKVVCISEGYAKRDALAEQHLALVQEIARKIKATLPPSFELDDLVATGYVGLLDAAARYRPNAFGGAPFSAYARQVIRGHILDSIRRGHYTDATHAELDPFHDPGAAPTVEIRIDTARSNADVRGAVSWLPEKLRVVVEAYYTPRQPTLAEVAGQLGQSASSVKAKHVEAIREMRRQRRVKPKAA
ncbi:MAG: hypothetical protein NVSMB64_14030 [Candidatus Velthaea sp.]